MTQRHVEVAMGVNPTPRSSSRVGASKKSQNNLCRLKERGKKPWRKIYNH